MMRRIVKTPNLNPGISWLTSTKLKKFHRNPERTHNLHICQEALANAAKHAKAKRVEISLWFTDDRALMEIRDDGKGFDMETQTLSIGHGMANMQTRAASAGGDLDVSSAPGEGTTILAWVPRKKLQ